MMASRFPRAWNSDVSKDEKTMVYVPTDSMGIGARKSNLPDSVNDIRSLEHVGKEARGESKRAK
jgi:hypothetical protein